MNTAETWVIMDKSKRFIVKGKSEKWLLSLDEPSRKETVTYKTEMAAHNAIKSSIIYLSPIAGKEYAFISVKRELAPVKQVTEEENKQVQA